LAVRRWSSKKKRAALATLFSLNFSSLYVRGGRLVVGSGFECVSARGGGDDGAAGLSCTTGAGAGAGALSGRRAGSEGAVTRGSGL
jgi:hypothetical protein